MAAAAVRSMRYCPETMPRTPHAPRPHAPRPRARGIPGPVKLLGLGLVAYGLYHRTRWYREGNRLFYANRRPNRAGRVFGDFWVTVSNAGLGPDFFVALETVGHKTGRRSSIPLVVADHGGAKYLVSMLGERAPWVPNVRAAGGRAVLRHGEPPDAPLSAFEAIAADYPVFRSEPPEPAEGLPAEGLPADGAAAD